MTSQLLPLANHLWQSTLFAVAAGLLTLLLRNNRAHARYCLWLAASAKFLIPFSLLVFVGSQFARHTPIAPAHSGVPLVIAQVEQVNEPFGAEVSPRTMPTPHPSRSASFLLPIVLALWAAGFGVLAFSWWRQWRRMNAAFRRASPVPLAIRIPVRSSPSFIEPGVFGVFRPVLLLPDGIAAELAPAELQAVLAHELCHVRRRDNLATAMHMVVETVFWFHPLVWWLGARLMEERERACDEEVLRSGSQPEAYAEGILKICELYLQSPLKCAAGVTGANLKKRIEGIMNNRSTLNLSFLKKAGLAIAGALAIAIPVILGVTNAPLLRAQSDPNLRFEVASVRRVEIPANDRGVPVFPPTGGIGTSDPTRYTWHGAWLMNLMTQAFGVRADQITGAAWLKVQYERYDIVANIPEGATKEQFDVMLGNLLRDRFHLRFHMDSKILPVYALRVSKNGPKFKETARRADDATTPRGGIGAPDAQGCPTLPPNYQGMVGWPSPGEICWAGQDVLIAKLAGLIEQPAGRPVIDETGLAGHYDFKIRFENVRRPADSGVASDPGPSIFSAVEQQLGLKLESSTHPFPQLIIDSIDRDPTEN
jgi:bla regulator protein BlaR1